MKKLTTQDFIAKAKAIHGDKYDYSKVVYQGNVTKVTIVCPDHGEFEQPPYDHVRGRGCIKCGNLKRAAILKGTPPKNPIIPFTTFVERANAIHNNKYSYDVASYKNIKSHTNIQCHIHGVFTQLAIAHTYGQGCPKCSNNCKMVTTDFINKAIKLHSNAYDYSKVKYMRSHDKVSIICKNHGVFYQSPNKHLRGQGCPKCANIKISLNLIASVDDFIAKAKIIHGDTYEYSKMEQDLADFCKTLGTPVLTNHKFSVEGLETKIRRTVEPNSKSFEVDMFLPDHKLAVEFNGLYWHSEDHVSKTYHADKYHACKELGIELIQVFEDEWVNTPSIVKSIIATRVGVYEKSIMARKTKRVNITAKVAREFVDANHLSGFSNGSDYVGLYHGDELVQVVIMGGRSHLYKNQSELELVRFCTKLNYRVVGGLSKLLAPFAGQPIKTYCDLRLFNGSGYKACGFELLNISTAEYYYIKDRELVRHKRFGFQKHKLHAVLETFDANLTEHENCKANGYKRIYGVGNLVMIKR